MNKLLLMFMISLCVSCQYIPVREVASEKNGKKNIKEYFKNVPEDVRNDALSRAELFSSDYDPSKVAQYNIVSSVKEICGEEYTYEKTTIRDYYSESPGPTKESYTWPKVSCKYHQDVEKKMGGGSTKFLCDFPSATAKDGATTRKVKYAENSVDPLRSEVVETTIAFNLAKLIGYYTNSYCPAVVECQNCPNSNPWRSNHASVPPGSRKISFEWAITDRPLDAYMISTPGSGNAPRGVDWSEIKLVKADTEDERKRILIEREAWMLWMHFLQHTDGADFNQRLSCLEAEADNAGKYYCKKPVLYTHDYGHAFYRHLNYWKWSRTPVFQDGEKNAGCKASMTKDSIPSQSPLTGVILGAEISAEARDLLVERLSRVTDDQWKTLFQLARAEEASQVSSSDWLYTVKRKIKEMKSAGCLPFSAGKSVLAH